MRPEVAVHGLGYVGLTAAVHYARAGWAVVGYDPDRVVVERLRQGRPRAGEFLGYLDEDVRDLVASGRLRATDVFDEAAGAAVHVIAVPTEREGEPRDDLVEAVVRRIWRDLPAGGLVMIESTLTPGTVDRLLDGGLGGPRAVGRDGYLAVCPRRDWFADRARNLATLPRVVGGVTAACTWRAVRMLRTVSAEVLPTDYRTAELVKALENALLHVPVMLLHEVAWAFGEADVAEAVELLTTHWRFESLRPLYLGCGPGGRCVPLGPRYLDRATGGALGLIRAALTAEAAWPERLAEVLHGAGIGTALVLGIAYRPEFRDAGRSPGLRLGRALEARGVRVQVHDPLWPPEELARLTGLPVRHWPDGPGRGLGTDAVVLATPHAAYRDWPAEAGWWHRGQRVLDGQGAWRRWREQFRAYGVAYARVGEPGWQALGRRAG